MMNAGRVNKFSGVPLFAGFVGPVYRREKVVYCTEEINPRILDFTR